jgi:hypothetical protein
VALRLTEKNKAMNIRQIYLSLLALGVLLVLVLAPQTRWLVRLQTLTLLHQYRPLPCAYTTTSETNDMRLYHAAAARHPGDFQLQYADATLGARPQTILNLRALTQRFPNNPMLLANLLRYESSGIHSNRPDAFLLSGEPIPKSFPVFMPSTPETLALYDRDAAAGERADPDNAYFPLMRASGLFAARRDAEALAAVKRASVKLVWREYLTETADAKWRLYAEAFGGPGALPQISIWSSELLPEYQRLREAARITVYQAVLKEQAGHLEEGYELREAVRRCGDTMRVQSTTFIGSRVGAAISAIAEARPGGSPPLNPETEEETEEPSKQIAQQRLDAYCAYAAKIGHPGAAQRARDEENARRRIQGLIPNDSEFQIDSLIWSLVFWWMGSVTLLLNAAWLLIFGLLAAGRAKITLAAKPALGWKAALGQFLLAAGCWVFLALLFVCVSGIWLTVVFHAPIDWRVAFGVGGASGLAAWAVGRGISRLPHPRRIAVLKMAALLPVLVAAGYGLLCLVQWVAWPLAELPQGVQTLLAFGETSASDTEPAFQSSLLWICTAATLTVPLLLALTFTGAAILRRVSVPNAVTTGFRFLAVPVACLLVIAYAGVLLGTLRQERRLTAFNRQMISNSGRYFAARAGQAWPGPVK